VRPGLVVVPPPSLNLEAGVGESQKPVGGETLVAKAAVKALDGGILDRVAGLNERAPHVELAAT